nr:chaperone modulator CbpM [uncultured Roseovarius sp.]
MTHSDELVPMSEVLGPLSLVDLCRICGLPANWVIELVDEGILEPIGESKPVLRFESTSITVVRKVQRLQTDLGLNIPGVAMVLALADENARLKRRLQLLENEPCYAIRMLGPDD